MPFPDQCFHVVREYHDWSLHIGGQYHRRIQEIREDQVEFLQVLSQRRGARADTGDGAPAEVVFDVVKAPNHFRTGVAAES